MIPVSVVIVTKNEAGNIGPCLDALDQFDDIWVVDSDSRDGTSEIARTRKTQVVSYQWNKQYPKKRQWCLDHLPFQYDWVFFVDADEIVPAPLIDEIETIILSNPREAGFFVIGRYRIKGQILKHGIPNEKIVLLHRDRMEFPIVDDLDIPGMGEIEGHYQPVLKDNFLTCPIGRLKHHMIHNTLDGDQGIRSWVFRHEKYARWEAGMNAKKSWPKDPIAWRDCAKNFLRQSSLRPHIIFFFGLIWKAGFLDGASGLMLLQMRYNYLKKIQSHHPKITPESE